jgi:hypothetical protein
MTDRRAIPLIAGCMAFGAIIVAELHASDTETAPLRALPAQVHDAPVALPDYAPQPDELIAISLSRPLFSSTRRPPEKDGSTAELTDKRLAGIVIDTDRRLAIFAVTGAKPLTVTEGDRVNGWRIENISPQGVSLISPNGTQTLQPKFDPNADRPPRVAARGNPGEPIRPQTSANAVVEPMRAAVSPDRAPPPQTAPPARANPPPPSLSRRRRD